MDVSKGNIGRTKWGDFGERLDSPGKSGGFELGVVRILLSK